MTQELTGTTLTGEWPFLRAHAHRWVPHRVWESGDAAVIRVERGSDTVLVGVGAPHALADLLAGAAGTDLLTGAAPVAGAELPGGGDLPAEGGPDAVDRLLVSRGTRDALPPALRELVRVQATWDWMSTSTPPPPVAGEQRVRLLTTPGEPGDALDRVLDCLAAGYPERGRRPTDAELAWWGYELEDGTLAGVLAADEPPASAVRSGAGVHLSALAVRPELRRRGVGAALTAAATRWGLDRTPTVHLGLWADNHPARRLYTRLGYVTGHHVENLVRADS